MIFKFKTSKLSDALSEIQDYVVEKDPKGDVAWIVEMKRARAKRSISQLAYYWIICTICATKIGCTKEQAHKLICLENQAEIIKLPNGKIKLVPSETKEMTTDQFSQLITKARQWALNELDLNILTPDEFNEEARIKLLNDYDQMFY